MEFIGFFTLYQSIGKVFHHQSSPNTGFIHLLSQIPNPNTTKTITWRPLRIPHHHHHHHLTTLNPTSTVTTSSPRQPQSLYHCTFTPTPIITLSPPQPPLYQSTTITSPQVPPLFHKNYFNFFFFEYWNPPPPLCIQPRLSQSTFRIFCNKKMI